MLFVEFARRISGSPAAARGEPPGEGDARDEGLVRSGGEVPGHAAGRPEVGANVQAAHDGPVPGKRSAAVSVSCLCFFLFCFCFVCVLSFCLQLVHPTAPFLRFPAISSPPCCPGTRTTVAFALSTVLFWLTVKSCHDLSPCPFGLRLLRNRSRASLCLSLSLIPFC